MLGKVNNEDGDFSPLLRAPNGRVGDSEVNGCHSFVIDKGPTDPTRDPTGPDIQLKAAEGTAMQTLKIEFWKPAGFETT